MNSSVIKVATHNVGDHPKPDILDNLFDLGVVLATLQEMADQSQTLWKKRAGNRIDWFWPERPHGQQHSMNIDENPICWDAHRFHRIRSGSRHLTGTKHVGERGPGGPVMHHKWLNWVTLHDLVTGQHIVVGNMHTVPRPTMPIRSGLMRAQINGGVRWANNRPRQRLVLLNGDLNADLKQKDEERFLHPLWRAGFESCWEETDTHRGSFGKQQLDMVLLRRNPRAKIIDMQVPDLGFDHKPVLADIRLKEAS